MTSFCINNYLYKHTYIKNHHKKDTTILIKAAAILYFHMFEKIPKIAGIREFLKNCKKLLQEVDDTREPLILTKNARPNTVIISVRDYNRLIQKQRDLEIDKIVNEELKWEATYAEIRKNMGEDQE